MLFFSKKCQSYGARKTESYSPSLLRREELLNRVSGAAQRHKRSVSALREEERESWGVNQTLRDHPGSSTDSSPHVVPRVCWWPQQDQLVGHGV